MCFALYTSDRRHTKRRDMKKSYDMALSRKRRDFFLLFLMMTFLMAILLVRAFWTDSFKER